MQVQQFDGEFVRKFVRHQRIGERLRSHPALLRVIRRINAVFASVENDVRRQDKKVAFRPNAPASEHGFPDAYGDLRTSIKYASQIAEPNFGPAQPSESWMLYQDELATLRKMLPDAPGMFNFGVCYAYVDAILAGEFPDKQFVGIDLSAFNAGFNRASFPDKTNMTFLSGDAFDVMPGHGGWIFFHSRTLVLLPREFIQRLYKAAFDAGFKYIACFEQNGLSEETCAPYIFDTSDRPSVYWRDRMYNHNYPGLATEAGFTVEHCELFKTNHVSPDYRVLRMIARRH